MTIQNIQDYIAATLRQGKPLHGKAREWAIDLAIARTEKEGK